LLTDSGGYQMVSLSKLTQVTEDKVTFCNPMDDREIVLRPEDSVQTQINIGADIIMQLDDVLPPVELDQARVLLAAQRTIRWMDRCIQ